MNKMNVGRKKSYNLYRLPKNVTSFYYLTSNVLDHCPLSIVKSPPVGVGLGGTLSLVLGDSLVPGLTTGQRGNLNLRTKTQF